MARVVGQIIHRPGRVTVLWSEGKALLEPYHFDQAAQESLYDVARQARERLAAAVAGGADDAAFDLATLGHQLYRLLFQVEAPNAAAQAAHAWWQRLQAGNAVTSVELVSDLPGRVPWNLLCDQGPDSRGLQNPGTLERFWGFQYSLGVGRRVNPHRVFPYFEKPQLLIALDPAVESELPGEDRQRLENLATSQNAGLVRALGDLTTRLQKEAPDLLVILSRVERGRLLLGDQACDLMQLRRTVAQSDAGNPQPLVLLLGSGSAANAASWECFLGAASSELSSFLVPEVPGRSADNVRAGLAWLTAFLSGQTDVGTALRNVRRELGSAGLAYNGFCPPYLRVLQEGKEPDPDLPAPTLFELPAEPYRPLAPFDREDRALFVGREEETARFARLLDQAGARGIILHGPAGAGKASFLRAGVLPYLEDEAVGFLALRDRSDAGQTQGERDYPTLALRAGGDLIGQLAEALVAFCGQPFTYATPGGATVTVDLPGILASHMGTASAAASSESIQATVPTSVSAPSTAITRDVAFAGSGVGSGRALDPVVVAQFLEGDATALGRLLEDLTAQLPFELILVVEQTEDLVTQATTAANKETRQRAMEMLGALSASSARCKLILSMRTEFFGRVWELLPAGKDRLGWRDFYLPPLAHDALTEAILLPTATEPPLYATAAPHSKYRFALAADVADQIATDSLALAPDQQVGALSLAQAACAFLVERARERRQLLIGPANLRELRSGKRGRLDLMFDRWVECKLGQVPIGRSGQDSLRKLFQKLYCKQPDGAITRSLVPARELAKHWRGAGNVEEAVNAAAQAGLLDVQQLLVAGREGLYVSLAQDSLAGWSARQEIVTERRRYARSRVTDALFILVPLIALAAALTYYLMNSALREQKTEVDEFIAKKIAPELQQLRAQAKQVPAPLYGGALAQAQQALDAGNLLRARQHLLSQEPFVAMTEDQSDRRGFAWHYLWRRANPERQTLLGHKGLVHAVAASPDNELLATAGNDGTVRLWNLKRQGEVAAIFSGHEGPVFAVAFAPDGKTLASAGADKVIRIWEVRVGAEAPVESDKAAKLLPGHEGAVHALAYGSDANTLISGSEDNTVVLWDITGNKAKATLKEHTAPVEAIALAPDRKSFATGAKDGNVSVWDESGKKTNALKAPGAVAGLAFGPDGAVLACASNEMQAGSEIGAIRVWDVKTAKEIAAPIIESTGVFGVAFKPSSATLLIASKDFALRARDSKTGAEQLALRGHFGWIRSTAITPDGATVASSSYDNTVKLWNWAAPNEVLQQGDAVEALAFSNDDQLLASGGPDGAVKLWRVADGELLGAIKGQSGPITALSFVPGVKERQLAVTSWSENGKGSVKLWNFTIALGKLVAKEGPAFEGHTKGVSCLAFAKDRTLATGGADKTIYLWDIATGQNKHKLDAEEAVCSLAFSPSGRRLAAGDRAGIIRAWETGTGKRIVQTSNDKSKLIDKIQPHHGPINGLAMLTEDFSFLSAGDDHVVMQWSWQLNQSATLVSRAHHQPVSALVLLGGKAFATASWDRTVKLWDLRDAMAGEECFTLTGHTGPVRALAVSSDRRVLASAGLDQSIRIWRATAPAASGK